MWRSINWLPALVLFFMGCGSKTNNITEPTLSSYQVQSGDVSLSVITNSSPADGATFDEFLFTGGPSVTQHYNMISFSISPTAKFSNDSSSMQVPINANGQDTVFASASYSGYNTVTVTVGGVSKSVSCYFGPAWPSIITINPDSAFLTPLPGVGTPITADLLRTIGKVSIGTLVTFSDSTADSASSVGVFVNTTPSDSAGTVSTQYWLQDTSYHGYVYIIGAVNSAGTTIAKGYNRIRIR